MESAVRPNNLWHKQVFFYGNLFNFSILIESDNTIRN